jgi:hypothetical protein
VELVLQAFDLTGEFFEAAERESRRLRCLQGRSRCMSAALGADAVEAENLTRHLEAGHLIASVLKDHIGLERAGADCIDGFEDFA